MRSKVESHLLLDSAAARGVTARQGAGRIRHLEAKMLWLQQYAREHLCVHPMDGKHNIADLGTKSLNGGRIKALCCSTRLEFVTVVMTLHLLVMMSSKTVWMAAFCRTP